MDIAEISKQSGLPASTIRFYEEKGLIRSTGRHGLRRVFGCNILEQLSLISLGRHAGFTLEEIAAMFAPDGKPRIEREKLNAKAEELNQSIKQLKAMRDGLLHAAECPASSHLDCPKFKQLLKIATRSKPDRVIMKKKKQP